MCFLSLLASAGLLSECGTVDDDSLLLLASELRRRWPIAASVLSSHLEACHRWCSDDMDPDNLPHPRPDASIPVMTPPSCGNSHHTHDPTRSGITPIPRIQLTPRILLASGSHLPLVQRLVYQRREMRLEQAALLCREVEPKPHQQQQESSSRREAGGVEPELLLRRRRRVSQLEQLTVRTIKHELEVVKGRGVLVLEAY